MYLLDNLISELFHLQDYELGNLPVRINIIDDNKNVISSTELYGVTIETKSDKAICINLEGKFKGDAI